MNEEAYKVSYLKCQETLLYDVIKRCLDAEAKISLLSDSLRAKDALINQGAEKNASLSDQISQLLAGLDATTVERDTYREEHSKYRDEILALGDLKEKCDKIELNFEAHMKNYNIVNEAFEKLSGEHEQLKADHEKLVTLDKKNTKVKSEQKKDDWV